MAQLTPTEVRDAIVTANETFMAAFSRGDAAALAASYTADGQLLPPHSDIITGKQAIEAFWQSAMDMGIKQIQLESLNVEGEGHTAYDVGKVTLGIGVSNALFKPRADTDQPVMSPVYRVPRA
jgi:ketosteroid isomerase-like protein